MSWKIQRHIPQVIATESSERTAQARKKARDGEPIEIVSDVSGAPVAKVINTSRGVYGPELGEANARLVAAAPDLANALRAIANGEGDPVAIAALVLNQLDD